MDNPSRSLARVLPQERKGERKVKKTEAETSKEFAFWVTRKSCKTVQCVQVQVLEEEKTKRPAWTDDDPCRLPCSCEGPPPKSFFSPSTCERNNNYHVCSSEKGRRRRTTTTKKNLKRKKNFEMGNQNPRANSRTKKVCFFRPNTFVKKKMSLCRYSISAFSTRCEAHFLDKKTQNYADFFSKTTCARACVCEKAIRTAWRKKRTDFFFLRPSPPPPRLFFFFCSPPPPSLRWCMLINEAV